MTVPSPDGSRDRRIEDPTNLWLIHPAARALLRPALRIGVSANAVSLAGLALGVGAAICYARWIEPGAVLLGLLLSAAWLVADGLDGMIARATGTSSAFGRFLDGVCDHAVFILIYVVLASTFGTLEAWTLAVLAGAAHIVQASLYEGERARFHRRRDGRAAPEPVVPPADAPWLVRGYDRLAGLPDRLGRAFERILARQADPVAVGRRYAALAVPPMRIEAMLSANTRVWLIALACLAGNPRIFWWIEIVPMSLIAAAGLYFHRRVERGFVDAAVSFRGGGPLPATSATRDL